MDAIVRTIGHAKSRRSISSIPSALLFTCDRLWVPLVLTTRPLGLLEVYVGR